jgi:cell division protein FtsB
MCYSWLSNTHYQKTLLKSDRELESNNQEMKTLNSSSEFLEQEITSLQQQIDEILMERQKVESPVQNPLPLNVSNEIFF